MFFRFKKWIYGVIVGVFGLGIIAACLYLPFLANYSLVIKAKAVINKTLLQPYYQKKITQEPELIPQNISVASKLDDGSYVYIFLGRFIRFDFDNKYLYLADNNWTEYKFLLAYQDYINLYNEIEPVLVYNERLDDQGENSKPDEKYIFISSSQSGQVEHPFEIGDKVKIYWKDKRSLTQILSEARGEQSLPLNSNAADIGNIVRNVR